MTSFNGESFIAGKVWCRVDDMDLNNQHSSAKIITHCVDWGRGSGTGVGLWVFLRNRMMWNRYTLGR